MMYDKQNEFSAAQAPTTGTTVSTNVIDTGVANRNIGGGEPLELVVQVVTTATSGGSNTTQIILEDSADNSSFTTKFTGQAHAVATLVQGFEMMRMRLPAGLRRYLRISYVIAVADLTAGNFTAFLAHTRQDNVAAAPGFTVS